VLYSADITGGSLKLRETRLVAELLLAGTSDEHWQKALTTDNLLGVSRPATAIRICRLLRARLEPLGPELWKLVVHGSTAVATQATFAAALLHSRLLADFVDQVVRERYRISYGTLPKTLWDDYLLDCRARDPRVNLWRESTSLKCRNVIYHILEQVGLLDGTPEYRLQRLFPAKEILDLLENRREYLVLRCMRVSP
jgi:hypothetical protein